jgi:hemerythrin-like domain-containing protein
MSAGSSDALDFILREHHRQRQVFALLEEVADSNECDAALLASLVEFIRFDLTLHVIDEEEDFFPMLRLRCLPEDDIGPVLDQMQGEHAEDRRLAQLVRDVLQQALVSRRPVKEIEGGAATLREFAEHQKRHLVMENAVLAPFARKRLTEDDLNHLTERFAARRGTVAA